MGKWQNDIVPKVLNALEAYSHALEAYPQLEVMFYRLVSDGLISNT